MTFLETSLPHDLQASALALLGAGKKRHRADIYNCPFFYQYLHFPKLEIDFHSTSFVYQEITKTADSFFVWGTAVKR